MSSFFDEASLVMIPSGYKDQKVYSVKPLDGSGDLTFSRASSATRVASNGLIEKVRTNLITYSEDMVTAKALSSVTATNNVTTAPDGTTTAASVEADGVSTVFIRTSATTFGAVNFSLYLKYDSQQFVQIIISGDSGCFVNFDIQNGVIGDAGAKTTNVQIENVGNGWYRCSAYLNPAAAGSLRVYHVSSLTAGYGVSSTTIGNTYFTWGWQAEDGDIATDYIATTTAAVSVGPVSGLPRLDYLNSSCPRLLLEPQTTALTEFSEQLDNAYWTKENVTITANSVTSPDGYTNADTLTDDTTNGRHRIRPNTLSFTSGTSYTLSAFVKKNSSGRFLLLNAASAANARAVLNLDTLEIRNLSGTGKVEDYGNGWYRFSVTGTATVTQSAPVFIQMQNADTDDNYVGNGSSFYLWGINITATSYPQSYIPTLSTSVTRVADVASKTGISSLIGQTEGTFYAEWEVTQAGSTNSEISLSSGSSSFAIRLRQNTANQLSLIVNDSTPQVNISTSFSVVVGNTYKIAVGYKLNDYAFYVNGTQIGLDTTATVPACSQFGTNNGIGVGSDDLVAALKQALLFKTRLTNAQLAELTA
jgi:hypothetical protein